MITVDTREKKIPEIKNYIAETGDQPGFPQFEFRALDLGDYNLSNKGEVRIERKTIGDFCGSYPVLKDRLHNMRLKYDNCALMLEGSYSVHNGNVWVLEGLNHMPRMSYRAFSNFLFHQAKLGIMMFHTMSLEESIERLVYMHNYLPKLIHPSKTIKCGSPAEWLVQLPGISSSGIKKLQEKFDSPLDVLPNLPKIAKKSLEKW